MPPRPRIQPIIPVQPSPTTDQPPPRKKARKSKAKADTPTIVYSQPADNGTGQNIMTQLVYAVNFLKGNKGPIRLKDLAIHSDTALLTDRVLFEKFKSHDRVIHDPKTDLYSYRHDFFFTSKVQLLTEIQRHTLESGGISVKALKEVSKDAPALIEELEKDGDVLVMRTGKAQHMTRVFWNEIKPNEKDGGVPIEEEFRNVWRTLEVPCDADLLKNLESEGIEATAVEPELKRPSKMTKVANKKGKEKIRKFYPRPMTNKHLMGQIDLTKDYVPVAGPSTSQ